MTDLTKLSKAELAALIGDMTPSQIKKATLADLIERAKAATSPKRKPGADVILFLPADAQKEPRPGTKRATIIDMLRKPDGTTVEEIAAATGWSRAVAQSGLYVDVKGSGWGVERREGRLHLLPEGAK